MSSKSALEKAAEELALQSWDEVEALAESKVTITGAGSGVETVELDFADAISLREELKSRIDTDTLKLKEINDNLLVAALGAEVQKVKLWAGMTFEVRSGRSASKIVATRLLEQGVSLDQIQSATVEGSAYQYVQVNKPKPPKGA
jgi:hypothetical protein